jgi:hypothetical protein
MKVHGRLPAGKYFSRKHQRVFRTGIAADAQNHGIPEPGCLELA